MKTDVRGKTVLLVPRLGDMHADPVGPATTFCRECGATCTIAPASIDRLRAEPTIVVLCIECGMKAHEIEPFESFAPVSIEELREATKRRKRGKR